MRRSALVSCAALVLLLALPSRANAATVSRTWPVGIEPFGVTVDPRDGKVYVAISNSQNQSAPENMFVIDPSSPLPPTQIELPAPQATSVLDETLDRLFVTLANGTLAIVDVSSGTIAGTVANAGMLGSALDPTTHYVYAALANGGVAMTDGATGTLLHSSNLSGNADWAVALDVGRQRLYATNADLSGPTLDVFDARDLTRIARVALPEIPRLALAVDEARGLVYVSGFNTETGFPGSHLYAVDESSLTITKTLDVGLGTMAAISMTLDASSDTLYASDIAENGSGELVAVDTNTFTARQRSPLPWQPGQLALHPNGRVYVPEFNAQSLAEMTLDTPPSVSVTLSATSPKTNDVLTATAAGSDAENDPLTYTFTWSVNGATRRTTTSTAATDSFDLSIAGNGDKGDIVTVTVVASDGTLPSAPASATATVANTTPNVSVALDTKTPGKRDVVTATATGSDADGDLLTYTYVWRLNGKVVQTTTTTATTSALDLSAFQTKYGDLVSVNVDAFDGQADATASASSTVTVPKH